MPKKLRADQVAFELGLAESREQAKRLIMAGKVFVRQNDHRTRLDKPGQQLTSETQLELESGPRFVSRGGEKLLTAVHAFNLDFTGLVVLDAGASTGGFSDCALQHGASKVYAVDVGTAQLHEKLKVDPRIVSLEGVNLRLAPSELIPEPVDAVVADVSFISLTKVLPACLYWLKPGGFVVALIKPQFELTRAEVGKGVVRDEGLRKKAVDRVTAFCTETLDLRLQGIEPSAIKGPKGNQEYLALLTLPTESGRNLPDSAACC